jgi:hypothetical protein
MDWIRSSSWPRCKATSATRASSSDTLAVSRRFQLGRLRRPRQRASVAWAWLASWRRTSCSSDCWRDELCQASARRRRRCSGPAARASRQAWRGGRGRDCGGGRRRAAVGAVDGSVNLLAHSGRDSVRRTGHGVTSP